MNQGRHYERAFENYLHYHRIGYVSLDQAQQAAFAGVNPGITGLGLNCTRGWEILEGLLSEAP